MTDITLNEKIPFAGKYEVAVCGGGVAGAAAALSAARRGRKVMLIEKSVKLGGLATLGLINWFVPMDNGRGRQIIRGMADEFLRLSTLHGFDTIPAAWKDGDAADRPDFDAENVPRLTSRYSADIFALELTKILHDAGVTILFDSVVRKTVMQGCVCRGVVVVNKSGDSFYEADAVIDVTGDSDVLASAGVPTVRRGNFFTYTGYAISLESCKKAVDTGRIDCACFHSGGGGATLFGKNQPEGMPLFDGANADDVNDYLIRNQLLFLEKLSAQDRTSRDVTSLPGMPQFRTTRRIDGAYTLCEDDTFVHFADSVGAICDFERRDYLYEVPYRTLYRAGYPNLLTAGRSASADGYAWDVLRVIPPAILTGQAAGIAASLAVENRRAVYAIDVPALQSALAETGVLISFDDAMAEEAKARLSVQS